MGKANRKTRRDCKRAIRDGKYEEVQEDMRPAPVRRKSLEPIEAKTEAQYHLITSIYEKDITFTSGPAGTGKTYIAASLAADELRDGNIERIIVARPIRSCGEDMGFLPGEEAEKYAPWVQPVRDVLEERLGARYVDGLIKNGRIQFSPLMTMRGSSFKDSWILLDEAQNVTPDQMKMFLTRIGENCKMIISGDVGQNDLVDGRGVRQLSGLEDALNRLSKIAAIGHIEFTNEDIVRHGIIREILMQY